MLDEQHSLEDWVAVKEAPFESSQPQKNNLRFIINWDVQERHLSITCHETRPRNVKRTLARNSKKAQSVSSGNSELTQCSHNEDLSSWTGIFTLQDITYAHQQLCLIKPDLENHPPNLPYEPRGIWSLLYSVEVPYDFNQQLELYLLTATQICGNKLLTDYLFSSEVVAEQYFENCSELRRKAYADDVLRLEEKLQELFIGGEKLDKMVDMVKLYSHVDSVLCKLATAQAELFNVMLQPFLDMRELSFNKLLGLQDELEDQFMSQGRRDRCLIDYSEWQEHYAGSIEAINEIRVKYFAQCVETTKVVISQLEKDKQKFGKSTWELNGKGRLKDFNQVWSQERIQFLQARQEKYKHRIEKIKQEMALLEEGPNYDTNFESLDQLAFDLQVKYYDTQLAVLQEQDKFHRLDLAQIKEELKEQTQADEAQFFDALESLIGLDFEEDDDPSVNVKSKKSYSDPRIVDIQSKLSKTNRKKASIRSNKQSFVAQHQAKVSKKKDEGEHSKSHHWIQMKRDQLFAEQEKRRDFIKCERKKTIDRLQNYKLTHPSPKILKPQQYKKSVKKDETRQKKEEDETQKRIKRDEALARDRARRAYQPPKPKTTTHKNATKFKSSNESEPVEVSQPTPVQPPPPPCHQPISVPPPPPPCPQLPPCPPPLGSLTPLHLLIAKRQTNTSHQNENVKEEGGGGIDVSELLKARRNLQSHSKSASNNSERELSKDPMKVTLANIRQGVKLRKIKRDPSTFYSPFSSLEDTELMARIRSIRHQTETLDDSDSEADFSP